MPFWSILYYSTFFFFVFALYRILSFYSVNNEYDYTNIHRKEDRFTSTQKSDDYLGSNRRIKGGYMSLKLHRIKRDFDKNMLKYINGLKNVIISFVLKSNLVMFIKEK